MGLPEYISGTYECSSLQLYRTLEALSLFTRTTSFCNLISEKLLTRFVISFKIRRLPNDMASSPPSAVGPPQPPSLSASKGLSAEVSSQISREETVSRDDATSFNVVVHPYQSRRVPHTCLYELAPTTKRNAPPRHALLFIGGLGDGPHTVPMIRTVSKEMETVLPDWSVFEMRLGSSFDQWGFRSLEDDRVGIEDAVQFLYSKLGKEKMVLMGHSTGCQVSQSCLGPETRVDQSAGLHGVC